MEKVVPSLFIAFGIFLGLAAGEVLVRARHALIRDIPFFSNLDSRQDQELGWKGREVFGDPNSKKTKVLFIGDSFSHGVSLNDPQLYHAILSKQANLERFMYAGLGYGSLQELIVLKRMLNRVKPDLIMLQVCSNDFINNSWELESQSALQQAPMERPYLRNDKIEILWPRQESFLPEIVLHKSRLAYFVSTKYKQFKARDNQIETIEDQITKQGRAFPAFLQASELTKNFLEQIKTAAGDIPLFVFSSDSLEPYRTEFLNITNDLQINFSEQAALEIQKAKNKGQDLFINDGAHWNEEGHQIIADSLLAELNLKP